MRSSVFSSSNVLPDPGALMKFTHRIPWLAVALAQLLGENLVLVQDFLFNFDSAHSSTSMYAMSNSSPLMHWVANSPHCGH